MLYLEKKFHNDMNSVRIVPKILILCSISLLSIILSAEGRGVNGGMGCAVCTVVFGITDQLAEIHNETIFAASVRLCDIIPYPSSGLCKMIVHKLEPFLINILFPKMITPDVLCYSLGFCHKDHGHGYCHLFPRPIKRFDDTVARAKELIQFLNCSNCIQEDWSHLLYNWCILPGMKEICEMFVEEWVEMAPAFDADNDMFSLFKIARGSHWRGRDCRDWDNDSYPGRKSVEGDKYEDKNCNGIWGYDRSSGFSWEEKLCGDSDSRGLIILGDSVSAHFHFPGVWMNPLLMSPESFRNFTDHLMDEFDWPHLGFMTGYENSTEPQLINGKTDSLYWRLRSRNRCNHRDYQNVCRNGASSLDLMSYVENVVRNHSTDKPAIVVYAAVGNDVCNSFKKTIENMTTPLNFKNNVLHVLERLEKILPYGSHVILLGLVNGGFIFPTMADRFHPLGKLRGDIRYSDVYNWFTCMEIGPCVGWMSPNTTLRQFTTQRAKQLNQVLNNISLHYNFKNFDVYYLENPFHKVLHDWEEKGKPLWQLLDQVDSLHPSQVAQSLIVDALWQDIMDKCPHILGSENKHNPEIQQLFGDQGKH